MNKKIKNILFLIIVFNFIFWVTKYYFSEQNITFTNKSRSLYLETLSDNKSDLPILENDTINVVTYINDLEDFKKKRKERFWETLFNKNE